MAFDYEEARATFGEIKIPEKFNFTADVIDRWARTNPEKLALLAVRADGTICRKTFSEISEDAARAATLFRRLGIGKGDRVLVQLGRVPEWYPVVLGLFRLGAVPIPGTSQLTSHDIEYRAVTSSACMVVVGSDHAESFEDIASDCPSVVHRVVVGTPRMGWVHFEGELFVHDSVNTAAEVVGAPVTADRSLAANGDAASVDTMSSDPLLIYFTSGTTGPPKMVVHTHASLGIGHIVTAKFWHALTPDDIHWTISDFGWAKAAWGKLFGQWQIGATLFLWEMPRSPDYDRILRLIGEHRVTSFCAPPTIYRVFVQMDLSRYDFSSLRHCTAAGEPLNPEVMATWKSATGLDIYDGYGQTETVCIVANFIGNPIRPGSMGRPMPGFDVNIVDENGIVVGDNVEGSIAVKTSPRPVGLFREYKDAPEQNAVAFRNDWYYTGDRAFRDVDGYFWFVGRDDDVILSAGYRIGPFEVESALIEHPAVMEAAVIGKADATRGQIVKAYVVLAPNTVRGERLAEELQAHVRQTTAPYKYPREISFVDELPKTISGKIRRNELREREQTLADRS